MTKSDLQGPFLREFAANFQATRDRILSRLAGCGASPEKAAEVVDDELRGLYHGVLVIFDGGMALADQGQVCIVDESGDAFDRFLHEICFEYWAEDS